MAAHVHCFYTVQGNYLRIRMPSNYLTLSHMFISFVGSVASQKKGVQFHGSTGTKTKTAKMKATKITFEGFGGILYDFASVKFFSIIL